MKLQIFDADYTTKEGLEINLYGKNKDGVYKINDTEFKPYFYAVPEENIEDLEKDVKENSFETEKEEKIPVLNIEKVKKTDSGEEIDALKIVTDVPANVSKLKNEIWSLESVKECREFDLPFYRRYLIDKHVRPGSWVEIQGHEKESDDFKAEIETNDIKPVKLQKTLEWNSLAFDLEVIDDKVVMASFFSEDVQKVLSLKEVDHDYVEQVEDESEMLEKLIEIIEENDTDILLGYNTDEFDFPVLREAADRTGVKLNLGRNGERMKFNRRGRFKGARIKARMHLDIYPFVTHVLAPGLDSETLDLDSVAQEIIGENKNDLEWSEMKQIWREDGDLEKFAEYALKDSEITYKLGQQITPQILELSKITGLIPFDTCRLTYGQLTENYLLRESYERNMLARNRPSQKKRNKRDREQAYQGGFVYTPEEGLYENVAVFDFRSLYPTVMVAHNISPETLNVEECENRFELEEFDYNFCQDQQGFFPELVENLVEERYQLKSKLDSYEEGSKEYNSIYSRQKAEKILANSVGPDTHIVLKNPEDEIVVRSIEEFYNCIESSEKSVRGSKVKEVEDWDVLSVKDDKAIFKPVYAASQHKSEDNYRVRTRMGEVTVTGDHSLISMKGEPSNRVRDSSFEKLGKVKGSEVKEDDIIAQVNSFELNDSEQEIIVPDILENCPESFYLYIPKSENLEKRDWYGRRVKLIKAVENGVDSSDINSGSKFGNKTLANAINEGLIKKTQIVGDHGNIYECEVTEKGNEYKKFYETFQKKEKNSRHYLIPLKQLEELPPRDMLEKSYVANKDGRARNKIPAVIELDEEFASLLGWFVAEGHFRKEKKDGMSYTGSAIASDSSQQRKEIQRLFNQVFNYDASINGRQVSCCTSTIARLFSELCGSKAEKKKVPEPIFNCKKPVRRAFLESYALGDGDEDGRRFSTISKKLQSGLSTLLKEQDTILHNGYDTETYRISKRTKTQGKKIVSGDLYGQNPIEIEETEETEKVYDISVKDTEKFVTAQGLVLHNSFYGYLGYGGARWYSRESAEATTYLGREYIHDAIKIAEDMDFEMVYGDTDSVLIRKDDLEEHLDDFLNAVNSELPEFMELEFEGLFKRGFFTSKESGEGAKKKYALMDEEGKMKITGFEQVRRDWSPIAKDTQEKVLRKVLENKVDEAAEEVKETIEALKSREIDVDRLKIYTTLTKPPEEYGNTAPHVEAAKKAKKKGDKIEPETTVDYVITRRGKTISEKAKLTKYAETYDPDYYVDNQVIPVALRVLKVFGYTEDELKGKGRQSGLGQF